MLLALTLLASASTATAQGRVQWPGALPPGQQPTDPALRVPALVEAWRSSLGDQMASRLEQARVRDGQLSGRLLGLRAVALRLQGRDDEAARVLGALAPDPLAQEDPEVTLTRAYFAARAEQWAAAVAFLRQALPRMSAPVTRRETLLLEGARWSMARGPEGLPEALALARDAVAPAAAQAGMLRGIGSSLARATLACALFRAGAVEEAREVALAELLPNAPAPGALRYSGQLLAAEERNAVLVALALADRGAEALAGLEAAAQATQGPWRESMLQALALARRSPTRSVDAGAPRGR